MEEISGRLPTAPLLATPQDRDWPSLALRHFRHPPAAVSNVSLRDHLLVVHLSTGLRVEEEADGAVRRAIATAGSISLTPAGQVVSRCWDGPSEVLLIMVGKALVDAAARDLGADPERVHLAPRLASPDADLDRLGHLLLSQAAAPGRDKALMVETLARAVALHLVRHHSNLDERLIRCGRSQPPRRIARLVEYMRADVARNVTVPQLAEAAGLSTAHLTRAFRESLGTTPHAYLIDLRLEKACELLTETERSITEIAFACGFEQSQHFAVTFRRRFGISPTAWRRLR